MLGYLYRQNVMLQNRYSLDKCLLSGRNCSKQKSGATLRMAKEGSGNYLSLMAS